MPPEIEEDENSGQEGTAQENSSRESHEEKRNKVVNIQATAQLQVVLVKPEVFTDAKQIADHLIAKKTVVLNLETASADNKRRIIDFLAGVAYANGGSLKPVANLTYIITPYNVGFVGEDSWVNSKIMESLYNDSDSRFLKAKLNDMLEISEKNCMPVYSDFLDERQAGFLNAELQKLHCHDFLFFGGYDDAQRKILCVHTPYYVPEPEDFPLNIIQFSYRKADVLTHRDFLGSVMACRIKREKSW